MERRRSDRVSILTGATVQCGNSMVIGNILDVSSGGVFFEPIVGYVDGEMLKDGELLEEFNKDEKVTVSIENEKGFAYIQGDMVVRWGGHSGRNNTEGFGLQWEHDAVRTQLRT
jgi:hypothetical protein